MKPLVWIVAAFVAGAATAAAAFVALPSLTVSSPAVAPVAHTPQASAQTEAMLPSEEDHEPDAVMGDPLGELDVVARIAIMRWVAANPKYEFITRDYCGCHDIPITNCPEYDERRARELSDYPYSDVLDYNGDKRKDFAVMLGEKGKEGPQILLIFNAPFGDTIPVPAFSVSGLQINDRISGSFAGPPESDNGYDIRPKGETYELVYMGNPG